MYADFNGIIIICYDPADKFQKIRNCNEKERQRGQYFIEVDFSTFLCGVCIPLTTLLLPGRSR